MTTVNETRDANLAEILRGRGDDGSDVPEWLQRIDHWATRGGDLVNPILVKETRQALKSRQFVVTFSLLLFASLAWTIVGSVMMMPQIYYTPSAVPLLIGYYLVLAVPMLLVVPLAAYRSLEAEVDDGTLELLSVTALSPRLIVTGKLASAALQMLLYFVALFPCVAYAYTLRGVDLATLALLMGMLVVGGLGLTMVALFVAPVSSGRTGQISGLLAVLTILLAAEFALGSFAVELIQYGIPGSAEEVFYGIVATLALCSTIAAILLMATVAKLTPESENRSTGVRLAILAHMVCVIALAAYAILRFQDPQSQSNDVLAVPMGLSMYLVGFWTFVGPMMAAESAAMTPRIRRELPGTFLGRLLFTWLMPGPATGLVFAVATFTVSVVAVHVMVWQLVINSGFPWIRSMLDEHRTIMVLVVSYLMFALVGVRGIVAFLRTRGPVKVPVGIAAMAVVLLLMAVIPYAVELHLNDYRQFEYSSWQLTNWIWTLDEGASGSLSPLVMYMVIALGSVAFLTHLLLLGRHVLPQRLATPLRVQEEYRRMAGLQPTAAEEINPLGLGTEETKP